MTELVKVRFGFFNNEDDPIYDGFCNPNEDFWNGWLQPYVNESTFKQIVRQVFPYNGHDVDDREFWEEFLNQKPNKDGLYDVGFGFCWMMEEDC